MIKQDILSTLRNEGFRITAIKRQTLEHLQNSDLPLSVSDLLGRIKANKTTIYREIAGLLENGYVIEVDFGDRIKRYELASRDHHHHLVCLSCKTVTDVELEEDLSKNERAIQASNNFKVLRHNLEFFGLCQNCSN